MRTLLLAAAALLIAGTAVAQDTTGASRNRRDLNPQTVPGNQATGQQPATEGASRQRKDLNPQTVPEQNSTTAPAAPTTNDAGQSPERRRNK